MRTIVAFVPFVLKRIVVAVCREQLGNVCVFFFYTTFVLALSSRSHLSVECRGRAPGQKTEKMKKQPSRELARRRRRRRKARRRKGEGGREAGRQVLSESSDARIIYK